MVNKKPVSPSDNETGIHYEIKVKDHLKEHWADWLDGLSITHDTQGWVDMFYEFATNFVESAAVSYRLFSRPDDYGIIY